MVSQFTENTDGIFLVRIDLGDKKIEFYGGFDVMNDDANIINNEIDIIKKPLSTLKVSKSIIDKIEGSTSCEMIKDLWVLTPKELCVHIGLTRTHYFNS